MKTLGILGGIGPESTGHFYLELIRRFQEMYRPSSNAQYPHIIINSISAEDLIERDVDQDVLVPYKNGLQKLEEWGADSIVIACNSAYCFIENLASEISVPIIHPRDAVAVALKRSNVKRICVIASPTTIQCGLYEFNTVDSLEHSSLDISCIGDAITKYNLGILSGDHVDFVVKIAVASRQNGYTVIAGCTEIHTILQHAGIEHIDPMQEAMVCILDLWQPFITLQKGQSLKHEIGIFTRRQIPKGEIFYTVPMDFTSKSPISHWAHFGGVWFCDESVVNWMNHSCDPNVELEGVNGKLSLRSLRDIQDGEEIVCDYNKTEIGGSDVRCTCKSSKCRGTFKRIDA